MIKIKNVFIYFEDKEDSWVDLAVAIVLSLVVIGLYAIEQVLH